MWDYRGGWGWGGLELTGDVGAGARWIVQAGRVLAQWASARGCWAQLGALFINGEQEMALSRVRTRSRADFVQQCEKLSGGQPVDRSGGTGR